MKFNAVIGNPPYQETKGGTKNVQIWQYFIEIGNKITEKYASFIHPGRWVVPKAQMESVRDGLLNQGLKEFSYYNESSSIFPSTDIAGGLTVTNYEKNYKGKINCFIEGEKIQEYNKKELFVRNAYEQEVVDKLLNKCNLSKNMEDRKIGGMSFESCFGYEKKKHINLLKKDKKGIKDPIHIWTNGNFARAGASTKEWFYIEKHILKDLPDNIIQTRKVMINKTGTNRTIFDNLPEIIDKKDIGVAYLFLPEQDTDYELKLIQTLFATKTARFLMSLTQKDLCVRGFENIPDYTYFQSELEQMGQASAEVRAENEKQGYRYWTDPTDGKTKALFSDRYFYDKFGFSQELIDYIESHISEKRI